MEFSEDFFKKEVRNDFVIPEMMKRAWAAEIEVLEVIDDICKKNDLKWFADGGTLLGAIRHEGFIPWDDDIDIAMLRSDYNRLIELLPRELPMGFSIAGMYSNDKRLQDAAKVQQLRVIADEKYWDFASYMSRFHGFPCFRIGIDIFPLDYVYSNRKHDKAITNLYLTIINMLTNWNENNSDYERIFNLVENETGKKLLIDDNIYNSLWRASEELIKNIPEGESEYVTNYFYRCYYMTTKKGEYIVDKNAYSEVVKKNFEFFKMQVPVLYEKVLKSEYGDYTKFLKSNDTHKYPFYKDQLEGFEKMLLESNIQISAEEFCRNWMKVVNFLKQDSTIEKKIKNDS